MSRRKAKVKPPKAKRRAPEYSIVRALDPLSPEDEAALCAFVAEGEKKLKEGAIKAWRLTRGSSDGPPLTWLEVRTPEDEVIMGHGTTISEAVSSLSKALINAALSATAGGNPN